MKLELLVLTKTAEKKNGNEPITELLGLRLSSADPRWARDICGKATLANLEIGLYIKARQLIVRVLGEQYYFYLPPEYVGKVRAFLTSSGGLRHRQDSGNLKILPPCGEPPCGCWEKIGDSASQERALELAQRA